MVRVSKRVRLWWSRLSVQTGDWYTEHILINQAPWHAQLHNLTSSCWPTIKQDKTYKHKSLEHLTFLFSVTHLNPDKHFSGFTDNWLLAELDLAKICIQPTSTQCFLCWNVLFRKHHHRTELYRGSGWNWEFSVNFERSVLYCSFC